MTRLQNEMERIVSLTDRIKELEEALRTTVAVAETQPGYDAVQNEILRDARRVLEKKL